MASSTLRQAIDAIKAGRTVTGKRLLVNVLQAEPHDELAWLWMTSVYSSNELRRICLQHVLDINPANRQAQRGLASLGVSAPSIWNERDKYQATRRWLYLIGVVFVVAWGVLIGWVLLGPVAPAANTQPLQQVVVPLLLATVVVERLLEATFNIVEGQWRAVVAYFGRGFRWLKSAEAEVQQARQALAAAAKVYASLDYRPHRLVSQVERIDRSLSTDSPDDAAHQLNAAKTVVTLAEQRLAEAERRLDSATTSAGYRRAKATASIVWGMTLGVIAAELTALHMFGWLGLAGISSRLDACITGLVIGAAAYPIHSLVGLLQQLKDLLDSARRALDRANRAG